MTVTSYKAEVKNFNHYIEVQGTVKADQTIELHAEMGGTVTAILIKEGQNVSKGQILATLDSDCHRQFCFTIKHPTRFGNNHL